MFVLKKLFANEWLNETTEVVGDNTPRYAEQGYFTDGL